MLKEGQGTPSSRQQSQERLVSRLFEDQRIAVAEGPISAVLQAKSGIAPSELVSIANVCTKRRREFIASRMLTRRAFSRLQIANAAVPIGPDRAPIWPAGIVGSITHTDSWCAAAIAKHRDFCGIGIDVECLNRLERQSWQYVFTDRELSTLSKQTSNCGDLSAAIIFSAKESVYKAQYPVTGEFLDFNQVDVRLDFLHRTFHAALTANMGKALQVDELSGSFTLSDEVVATAVVIEVSKSRSPWIQKRPG